MKFKSITTKLNFIFVAILLVVLSSLIFITFRQASTQQKTARLELEKTVTLMESTLQNRVHDAEGLALILAENETVALAVDLSNPSLLKRAVDPIYAQLSTTMGLSVLEIGDANGVVIHRSHNPEKSGDSKADNPSIAKTLTGSPVSGTEMGSSGVALRAFVPIMKFGKVIGTVQVGFADTVFQSLKESSHAHFEVYSLTDMTLSTETGEKGVSISTLAQTLQDNLNLAFQGEIHYKTSTKLLEAYVPIKEPVNQTVIGAYRITYSMAEINKEILSNLFSAAIVILISVAIIFFSSSRIKRTIVLPISAVAKEAQAIANGDLSVTLPPYKQEDEIGQLVHSFESMIENLRTLIISINDNAQTLASTSQELTATTQQSASASDEVAKAVTDIAENAQSQARETEMGVNRSKHLGENIEIVYHNMASIRNTIDLLNGHKAAGLNIITELGDQNIKSVAAINEIRQSTQLTNESARRIGEANQLIESIAEQTNLLALNAAIEAARAGEAGRGFSVVAEEIRKLAEQSTRSAKEISDMLEQLLKNADHSVKTMETVNQVISKQVEQVKETENKFGDISNGVEEVESVISNTVISVESMSISRIELDAIMQKLSEIAEDNAAGTEESAASVEEQSASIQEISHSSEALSQIALDLLSLITKFKL